MYLLCSLQMEILLESITSLPIISSLESMFCQRYRLAIAARSPPLSRTASRLATTTIKSLWYHVSYRLPAGREPGEQICPPLGAAIDNALLPIHFTQTAQSFGHI